jgi:ribokinase
MTKTSRIAVVGSANIDLTTFNDRWPRGGETIFGESFDIGFGGKGANQAVAAKLCGADVSMVARVGNDLFGPSTIENFGSMGIDAEHVRVVEGVSSGVAPIFVDTATGQNRILVIPGANNQVDPAAVDEAAPMLKQADCIVLQFEIPLETVYYTIRFANENGIRCILNPAPGQAVDMAQVANLDYFVPNETEAEAVTGIEVGGVEDAKRCAGVLLEAGIKRVLITLGSAGCLVAGAEGMEHVPAFEVNAVDTTGAGDAFIGSFAVFLGEGFPEAEAVRRANLYAGLSTEGVGTQKSFLDRDAFEAAWAERG